MLCAMHYLRKTKYTIWDPFDKIGSRKEKFFFNVETNKILSVSNVPQRGAFNLLNNKPNLFADLVFTFEVY